MTLSRRSVLAGAAGLPFVTALGRAARADTSTLRYGLQLYPPSFAPWQHTGTAAATVNLCYRRGLLSYSPEGKLRGELAESWEADDAGWRFRLRDAVFHNGKKVTATDVKWTIEQMAAEKSTAFLRSSMQQITAVETPDDRTVRLMTKEPIAPLPYWFALPQAPIISKDSPDIVAGAVGAGPFRMTANERGVAVGMEAFDKFYRPGLPKLKQMTMTVYADENLRVSALQAGDLDLIEYVPWQSIDALDSDPNVKLDKTDGPFMYLTFNGRSGPFKDKRVREAVAFAVKRDEVTKAAFFGHASSLRGVPMAKDSRFYNEQLANGWTYDPARSKRLLAEAGLGGGFSCTLLSNVTNGMHKSTAEVVQQNLADIGIQVQLALPDWAGFVTLATRGQYEFAVNGTTFDNDDPDGMSSVVDGSLSPAANRSTGMIIPELTTLLAQGRSEFDAAKRKAVYDQVQQIVIDQVPVCFLVSRTQAYGMRKNVQGFRDLPGQLTFHSGYTLEETYLT